MRKSFFYVKPLRHDKTPLPLYSHPVTDGDSYYLEEYSISYKKGLECFVTKICMKSLWVIIEFALSVLKSPVLICVFYVS